MPPPDRSRPKVVPARGPVRRLPPPPRVVRWKATAQLLRVLAWLGIVVLVGLAAFALPLLFTNSRAARDLEKGGVLTTARLLGVVDRAPEIHIGYLAGGGPHSRKVEISDDEAVRWQDALAEHRRLTSPLSPTYSRSAFGTELAIHVRVPEADPGAGQPLVDELPRDALRAPTAPSVVAGTVSEVSTRHRVVSIGVDGTTPPVTYTRTIGPRDDARVGSTFDTVYLPPNPTWNVTGPPGSLFPTPLERYGIPGAVSLVLVAGTGLRMERRRRRHRVLLETGVEKPIRILGADVSPAHGVVHVLLTIAHLVSSFFGGGGSNTLGSPAVRRRFTLRHGEETRELTRTAADRLAIPNEPGAHASVVCGADAPWEPVFVEELLDRMAVQPARVPPPGAP